MQSPFGHLWPLLDNGYVRVSAALIKFVCVPFLFLNFINLKPGIQFLVGDLCLKSIPEEVNWM